jgi:hypothetical protein
VGTLNVNIGGNQSVSWTIPSTAQFIPTVAPTVDGVKNPTDPGAELPYVIWSPVTITNSGTVPENVFLSASAGNADWNSVIDTSVYETNNYSDVPIVANVGITAVSANPYLQLAAGASTTLDIGIWINSAAGNTFADGNSLGATPTITYTFQAFQRNDTGAPNS